MKLIIKIVLTLFILCAFVFGQTGKQTVAIYMSGKEPSGAKGAHGILGAELAREISNSDNYSAVDRTTDFLEIAKKELVYQRSGAVSDNQIREIGKQFGVQYVCIMKISEVKGGEYQLEARIVDVETAEIQKQKSVSEISGLKNAMEMQFVAKRIAAQIVGKNAGFKSHIEALNKVLEKSFPYNNGVKVKGSLCDFNERTNVIIEDNVGYYIGEIIMSLSKAEVNGYGMEIAAPGKYIDNCDNCVMYVGNWNNNKKSGEGSCYKEDGSLIYRGNFSDDKPTDKFPSPGASTNKYKMTAAPLIDGSHYIGEVEAVCEENKGCRTHEQGYGIYIHPNGDAAIVRTQKSTSQVTKIPYNLEQNNERCALEVQKLTTPPVATTVTNEQISKAAKNSAIEYYNRGLAYYNKSDYDNAIDNYNKAIELNPNYANAYIGRGLAYRAKGDYDKAIDDYNKAIELNPNDVEAYNNRGVAYYNKSDYDNAIDNYNKAIELNPNFANAYYNRGIVYKGKGDYDKAIDDYNKAIELNPNFTNAYIGRGNAYYNKRDYAKAIDDYKSALRIDPNHSSAKISLEYAEEYLEKKQAQSINITKPSAEIKNIWVDHNVWSNNQKGMKIHIKFSVKNMLNKQGRCVAYFYFSNGIALNDYNNSHRTTEGKVSKGEDYKPGYESTIYEDFVLFMPYDELHLNKGSHSLKFDVVVFDNVDNQIVISKYIDFSYDKCQYCR